MQIGKAVSIFPYMNSSYGVWRREEKQKKVRIFYHFLAPPFYLLVVANIIISFLLMIALSVRQELTPYLWAEFFPAMSISIQYVPLKKGEEIPDKEWLFGIFTPFLAFLQQRRGCGFVLKGSLIFRPIKTYFPPWTSERNRRKNMTKKCFCSRRYFFLLFCLFHYLSRTY